jgi:3-isopropylmalate dehydrogenase
MTWVEAIAGRHPVRLGPGEPIRIGALRGEGVGPEVVSVALDVAAAACRSGDRELDVQFGPDPAPGEGAELTDAAAEFCRHIFARGGAILTGPHGGRWVYELRQRFDLFCKVSPLAPAGDLHPSKGPIWPDQDVDILVVREQTAGVYQGKWSEADVRRDGRVAEHSFRYSSREVRRLAEVGVELAKQRTGRVALVVKGGGVPSISRLWATVTDEVASEAALDVEILDIDFAVYHLLRDPAELDVVIAPNLFGDVIADAGGLLVGSRGLCFGASYDAGAAAVYQTNHGSAHDLAGSDRANPVAQILAAAAMLRESFAATEEAASIEAAVAATWRAGIRTDDISETGCADVGTREFGDRVVAAVQEGVERNVTGASRGAGVR